MWGNKSELDVHGFGHFADGRAALVVHADRIDGDSMFSPEHDSLLESDCRCFISEAGEGLKMDVSSPSCYHKHACSIRTDFGKQAGIIQMDCGGFSNCFVIEWR